MIFKPNNPVRYPVIYLDNAATTKPLPEVLDTFAKVNESFYANPHALHSLGVKAESLLEQSRKQLLSLLDGAAYDAIFTGSATEANNLALRGIAERYSARGKHIITSASEHPSVHSTGESLAKAGFELTILPVDEAGIIAPDQLRAALRPDTILVSFMAVNNEIGSVQDVEALAALVKAESRAKFHADMVQSIGKLPLSLKESAIDMLTLSAHKFHGLKGSGALVLKRSLDLPAQITGGDQEGKRRAGTADVASAASLAKALRLAIEELPQSTPTVTALCQTLRTGLSALAGVTINSPENGSPYILNASIDGVKPETLLHALAERKIYISTISACSAKNSEESRPVLAMTGSHKRATTSVRFSLSRFTTEAEIETVVNVLEELLPVLR